MTDRAFVHFMVAYSTVAVAWCLAWCVISVLAGSWAVVIHGACLIINAGFFVYWREELSQ